MKTILAEYKDGFWYIDGKLKLFSVMAYNIPINTNGWYYILLNGNTVIEAVKQDAQT